MNEEADALAKVREIFLTEVDEETRQENLEEIQRWESALRRSEAYEDWRQHDITRDIVAKARSVYVSLSVQLATDRSLDDRARAHLFAQQDAMRWLLGIADEDQNTVRSQIDAEIRRALARVS